VAPWCRSSSPRRRGLDLVERERRREVAEGVDLCLELADLLLGQRDCVGAGDEAARRLLLAGDGQQRLGELGRVAGLPAVLALPELALAGVALGVVLDRRLGVPARSRSECGSDGFPFEDPSPRHITGRVLRDTQGWGRRERRPYAGGVPARGSRYATVSERDERFHVEKRRPAPLTR
jgi:hypothetical protein